MKRLLFFAALAVFGCAKSSSHESLPPPASPQPEQIPATAVASAPSASAPVAEPTDVAQGPAPAGSGVSAADRRARVYDLLAGGPALEQLPLVDVEDGAAFDPNLRDRVAPAVAPLRIRVGKYSVRGSLDKNIVRRIVRRHATALRDCYTQNTHGLAPKKDTLDVQFVIDKSGRVVAAKKRTGNVPAGVTTCALRSLRRMRFPKPESGGVVVVDYGFEFIPPHLP